MENSISEARKLPPLANITRWVVRLWEKKRGGHEIKMGRE